MGSLHNSHEARISCLGLSADGSALCTGSWDANLKVSICLCLDLARVFYLRKIMSQEFSLFSWTCFPRIVDLLGSAQRGKLSKVSNPSVLHFGSVDVSSNTMSHEFNKVFEIYNFNRLFTKFYEKRVYISSMLHEI